MDEHEFAGVDKSPDHVGVAVFTTAEDTLGDVFLVHGGLAVHDGEEHALDLLRRVTHLFHVAEDERLRAGEHFLRLASRFLK